MRDYERDLSLSIRPVSCANPHCDSGEHVAVRGEFCRLCRAQQDAMSRSVRAAKGAQWRERRAVERETGMAITDDGTILHGERT